MPTKRVPSEDGIFAKNNILLISMFFLTNGDERECTGRTMPRRHEELLIGVVLLVLVFNYASSICKSKCDLTAKRFLGVTGCVRERHSLTGTALRGGGEEN